MKRIILLTTAATLIISFLQAQKRSKKSQPTTAYAITGVQKGQSNWTEVRLVDIATGEELKSIYNSKQEVEMLNARTGKPIVKKEIKTDGFPEKTTITYNRQPEQKIIGNKLEKEKQLDKEKKIVNLDQEINPTVRVKIEHLKEINRLVELKVVNKVVIMNSRMQSDKPFATNSAACAYDKKHERL